MTERLHPATRPTTPRSRGLRSVAFVATVAAALALVGCNRGPDTVADRDGGARTGEPGTGRAPSTVSSTTSTTSPEPPPGPEPTVLGAQTPLVLGEVGGAGGIEYPRPTTCSEVQTLVDSDRFNDETTAALAGQEGIWLAVDVASTSADILMPDAEGGRRVVQVRDGGVYSDQTPQDIGLPTLRSDPTYAIARLSGDRTVESCSEGPAV
jgi:hypothetical protein